MAYSCLPLYAASFLVVLLVLPLMAVASAAAPAAETSYETKSVGMCAPKKKLVVPESVCGRPLGLQFHHESGDLYVADAYLGLLRVPARGGLVQVVATEAGGVPFNFLNGLDVDQKSGDVYFTDSSSTYRRRGRMHDGLPGVHRSEYLLVVALGDETGRLLRYDPRTRRVAVLHAGLSYPNGVAVSADGSHVVVSHTALSELRRYWVRGPKAGRNETFAELPGFPDNVQFISLPKHCVQVRCRPGVLKYGVVGLAEVKENAWIRKRWHVLEKAFHQVAEATNPSVQVLAKDFTNSLFGKHLGMEM
ncbi:unnamed protein product [Triticum turgidum subsp. durum]|uniref:Strictosidine synthase conserved region domain-containing protein n=1 Tax=Triticum turgidum subsp. durum TaxID=4567 RepID=A0A9R0TV00_TRITD|nr:unnamed protein product [Triticum turgidum subsp. durum]